VQNTETGGNYSYVNAWISLNHAVFLFFVLYLTLNMAVNNGKGALFVQVSLNTIEYTSVKDLLLRILLLTFFDMSRGITIAKPVNKMHSCVFLMGKLHVIA
jgi:hypothetical protein